MLLCVKLSMALAHTFMLIFMVIVGFQLHHMYPFVFTMCGSSLRTER